MSLLLTLALSSALKLGKHKAGSAGHQEHIRASPDITSGKEKEAYVKGSSQGDNEGPREYWEISLCLLCTWLEELRD